MAVETVDATGLNCPLPILKARQAMDKLNPGDTLELLATDPGSVQDIQSLCKATGNELSESTEDGGVYRFVLVKSA